MHYFIRLTINNFSSILRLIFSSTPSYRIWILVSKLGTFISGWLATVSRHRYIRTSQRLVSIWRHILWKYFYPFRSSCLGLFFLLLLDSLHLSYHVRRSLSSCRADSLPLGSLALSDFNPNPTVSLHSRPLDASLVILLVFPVTSALRRPIALCPELWRAREMYSRDEKEWNETKGANELKEKAHRQLSRYIVNNLSS